MTRMFGTVLLAAATFAPFAQAQMPPVREALDGVDPVLLLQGKEIQGKPELKIVRGTFEYLFSSADTRAAFEKSPEKYEIQFSGACARMGPRAGGNPADYLVHDGKIYIFGSDDCHKKFAAAPEKYLPKPAPPMPVSARSVQQGRTLLERAVKAIGGAERVDSLTSYVESASQIVQRPQGQVPAAIKTARRFPGAVRVERTMTLEGKPMSSTTLVTPAGAWFIGTGRPFPMNAAARKATEEELGRQILPLLRSHKDAGFTVAALGPVTIEGMKTERVRVRHGGVDVTLNLDSTSGQLRRMSFAGRNSDGEQGEYTIVYADYRNIDGLMLPFSERALFNGTPDGSLSRTIDSIAVNQPLDSALFEPVKAGGQ